MVAWIIFMSIAIYGNNMPNANHSGASADGISKHAPEDGVARSSREIGTNRRTDMRTARDMTINLSGLSRSKTLCTGMGRRTAERCVGGLKNYVLLLKAVNSSSQRSRR